MPRSHRFQSSPARALSRRAFLRRSAVAAGALTLPCIIPARAWGAGETPPPSRRITLGFIGVGLMGRGHLRVLAHNPRVQVLAVCDVDKTRRDDARDVVEAIYASQQPIGGYKGCAAYNDYRELLARPDIDAVVITTPDHWHALQAMDAARAGKDIYCEKPVSMTLAEGRRLVEVVRRYGRVFQTGTQYRSIPEIRRVCRFIREGGLGRVKAAFTLLQPLDGSLAAERCKPFAATLNPDVCGRSYVPLDFALPAEPVPEGLDWDLWVGPAPWRPYNRAYHMNPSPGVVPWAFADAFGLAANTWYLSHAADVIQWALGVERSGPVEIIHPSTGQFPTLTCRYANGALLHFVNHWDMVKTLYHAVPPDARLAGNFGGVIVGERGWLTTMSTGGPIEGAPESLFDEMQLRRAREVNIGANDHHANWLNAIESRQPPSADEELGHRAAALGHLAFIALRLGCSLRWDPQREVFIGNDAANRLRHRAIRAPWRL
ncbi:MAG: Gfo/Idh/MocA family oxidoreductase [Verrucomicrobiales bacterium]|nr:Gfo/Idh/MocA family oxidoreductase [Verrucomicrobiales bacterium]